MCLSISTIEQYQAKTTQTHQTLKSLNAVEFQLVPLKNIFFRGASHLFPGGLAGIGKLPALVGVDIWCGITAYTMFLPLA